MNEYGYRIEKLKTVFKLYSHKRIFLYGTGASVNMLLDEFPDVGIVGLMDSKKEGTYFRGHYILSENEALISGIEVLMIPARFDSAMAVFNRMFRYCYDHDIKMLDIYGNDMMSIYKQITDHMCNYTSLRYEDLIESIMDHDTISVSMRGTLCYGNQINLKPRKYLIDIIRKCIDIGKRVIIYSDYNIKREICRERLQEWGIIGDFYLVDYNKYRISIYDGMFLKIKELSHGRLLHIGCDPIGDGYVPMAYGDDCWLIKSNMDLFRYSLPELFGNELLDGEEVRDLINRLDLDQYNDPFFTDCGTCSFPKLNNDLQKLTMMCVGNKSELPNNFVALSGEKKKILVAFARIPQFDTYGADRTAYSYLKLFADVDLDITFIPLDFLNNENYESYLKDLGIDILTGLFYKKHWIHWLIINGYKYDYVFMQLIDSALISGAAKVYCPNAKIAYCEYDLSFLRKEREYEITKDNTALYEAEYFKRTEFGIMKDADIIYTLGVYEKDILKEILPNRSIEALPVYIYEESLSDIDHDFKKRKDLLIVSHVDFEQNIDGILWFKENVFPKIVERFPDIIWNIVGKVSDLNRNRLIDDNIVVHGWMSDEDLKKLYDTCRIAVVPLRFGSGVKGKIIEAAYHGLPVVTTSVGAEGIPLDCGNILVVEDEDVLANIVIELYEDHDKLEKMSMAATTFIKDNYIYDVATKTLNDGFIVDR